MRTIVDLPEDQVKSLDSLGKRKKLSRAALVREAVERYLDEESQTAKGDLDKYFGVFKDEPAIFDGLDGLAWQSKIRAEWDERDEAVNERVKYTGFHEE
jgi:hypothetical protein